MVMERSASSETVVTSVTESLDAFRSRALDVTLAVLEMVPVAPGAVTVMVYAALALLAKDAAVQVTVPPDSLHPAPAETNTTPPASTSLTVTSAAVSGPALVTVRV